MNAIEIIRDVYSHGGRLSLQDGHLIVEATGPLPDELMTTLAAQKPAVMVALGAPLDVVVSQILEELRPNLPAPLRVLSDAKILVMVNWSIVEAWGKTIQKLQASGA